MLFCPEGLYQKGLLSCAIGQDILLFDHERVILVGLSIWLSDNLALFFMSHTFSQGGYYAGIRSGTYQKMQL